MKIGIVYDLKTDYTIESDTAFIDFEPFETFSRIKLILEKAGFNVILIGETKDICERIKQIKQCEIVFNFCEGIKSRNREALMPALFEKLKVKYVGSDATACALTVNKIYAKVVSKYLTIETPKWIEIRTGAFNTYKDIELAFPRVIKPNGEGNSGGIYIIENTEEQNIVINRLKKHYDEILIEEYISGREITVPIIGNGTNARVLTIVETLDINGDYLNFYDVEKKFGSEMLKVEANFSDSVKNRIIEDALKIYRYLNCQDFGRIDFRLSDTGVPYLLELNLLPSLELNSSFYHTASILKVDFSEIILSILHAAAERMNISLKKSCYE
jgi:D-alanine-D-alanine ligase